MFLCSKFGFREILVICVITKTFVQKSWKTNATNHSSLNGAMYVYTDLTLTDNLFFVFEAFPFYSKNIVWFVCFIDAHIRHNTPLPQAKTLFWTLTIHRAIFRTVSPSACSTLHLQVNRTHLQTMTKFLTGGWMVGDQFGVSRQIKVPKMKVHPWNFINFG